MFLHLLQKAEQERYFLYLPICSRHLLLESLALNSILTKLLSLGEIKAIQFPSSITLLTLSHRKRQPFLEDQFFSEQIYLSGSSKHLVMYAFFKSNLCLFKEHMAIKYQRETFQNSDHNFMSLGNQLFCLLTSHSFIF